MPTHNSTKPTESKVAPGQKPQAPQGDAHTAHTNGNSAPSAENQPSKPTGLRAAAQRYLKGGLSLIPIDHTTKQPQADLLPVDLNTGKSTWKPYQENPPTPAKLTQWLEAGIQAIAVVCGKVSGGLEIIDFDVDGFYEQWLDEVAPLVEQYQLPRQRTGKGYQVAYRAP